MFGTILKVNLSTGAVERGQVPADYVREYVGGSGLAARLLADDLLANGPRPPLDPASPLLFITGPLTGTAGPTTGRFTVCGRSPQTGLWGESNIGGFVGPELRFAGWDILWITGSAPNPVYLWIHDDAVEIRPASHLWGRADTLETQLIIRQEVEQPMAKVACIGLAGENGVSFAGILSDHGRLAARTGLGTLMGSKRLKALAVRGSGRPWLGRPETYKKLRVESNKRLLQQNMTAVLHATGTSGSADYFDYLGDMPKKYWTGTAFEGATDIGGAEMAEKYLVDTTACQGCVISCGRVVNLTPGLDHAELATPAQKPNFQKGPEYETICAFGSQLLVDDLPTITRLGDRCDRLGLDTISAGSVLGLAYLLFDLGRISERDTGGLALRWGDAAPCFSLLDQIARREGFGALLAQGSRALGAAFGAEDLAVQVNGLDVGMHDPRAFTGQGLAYVTSPRGACHNQSDFFTVELGGTMEEIGIGMTDHAASAGKSSLVARHQHWRTLCNDLVICFFTVIAPQEVADLLSAASGEDWTVEGLLRAGERGWNLKRCYNLRLGLTPASEKLPKLLLQSLPDGGQAGVVPDMDTLLDEYYAASGWDRASGWPTRQKLAELGLEFMKE
jgi:aldehyde:ferredoxin oxidoreductase